MLLVVLQGQYRKAHEVKVAADAMYYAEMGTTLAAYEAEVQMRKTHILTKQQGEPLL